MLVTYNAIHELPGPLLYLISDSVGTTVSNISVLTSTLGLLLQLSMDPKFGKALGQVYR
jgi:hypothetical protein